MPFLSTRGFKSVANRFSRVNTAQATETCNLMMMRNVLGNKRQSQIS